MNTKARNLLVLSVGLIVMLVVISCVGVCSLVSRCL